MHFRCLAHTEVHYFGYETPFVHSHGSCSRNHLNRIKLFSSVPFLGTKIALDALRERRDETIRCSYKARLYIALVPGVNMAVLVPADLFFTAVHHAGGLLCSDRGSYHEIN